VISAVTEVCAVLKAFESTVVICLSQAKIPCSRLCRCVGCKNFEESPDRQNLLHLANAAEVRVQQQAAAETKLAGQLVGPPVRPAPPVSGAERYETSLISFYRASIC